MLRRAAALKSRLALGYEADVLVDPEGPPHWPSSTTVTKGWALLRAVLAAGAIRYFDCAELAEGL